MLLQLSSFVTFWRSCCRSFNFRGVTGSEVAEVINKLQSLKQAKPTYISNLLLSYSWEELERRYSLGMQVILTKIVILHKFFINVDVDVCSKQLGAFVIMIVQSRKVSKFVRDQSSQWKQQLGLYPISILFQHQEHVLYTKRSF